MVHLLRIIANLLNKENGIKMYQAMVLPFCKTVKVVNPKIFKNEKFVFQTMFLSNHGFLPPNFADVQSQQLLQLLFSLAN